MHTFDSLLLTQYFRVYSVTKLKFSCLLLKRQYFERQMSTERKDVLIRKAGNLARKYTHVWRPTPKIPLSYDSFLGFIDGSVVKNPPAVQEMQVRFLGQKEPLEKGMVPSPLFLLPQFHGQRSLVGYNRWELPRVGHDLAAKQKQVLSS